MNRKIRIGGTQELDLIDTDGVAFSVFFQGCKKRCRGCHNPELQPMNEGTEEYVDRIMAKVRKNLEWYDSVAFMGGEPLEQPEALMQMLDEIEEMGLERWLYTGYEINEVPKEITEKCSVIVAGPYKEELNTGGFPASSNQVICDRRNTDASTNDI